MESGETTPRHSCLKLQTQQQTEPIFVKATWHDTHFDLLITDGLHSWLCRGTEEEVRERAAQWDQSVSDYIELAERYLGFQQPNSLYKFADSGDDQRRLSWTFEKGGIKLEWRWKCQPSPDCKKTTAEVLYFLMDANIKLSEEVVSKTKSFERLKAEAEKCLAQSERFSHEKLEFEDAIYAKFLGVLNAKKAKLRELRDKLAEQDAAKKPEEEDNESSEKTEELDEETSDDEKSEEEMAEDAVETSKEGSRSKGHGRKRTTRGS